jgi:hypothetical protein
VTPEYNENSSQLVAYLLVWDSTLKYQLLPLSVPIATAALLAGMGRESFRLRVLNTNLVPLDEENRVPLAALARYLGGPVDVKDLLKAERRRDPARKAQRQYRRTQCV